MFYSRTSSDVTDTSVGIKLSFATATPVVPVSTENSALVLLSSLLSRTAPNVVVLFAESTWA